MSRSNIVLEVKYETGDKIGKPQFLIGTKLSKFPKEKKFYHSGKFKNILL
jgi:hypothetical protein